MAQGFHGYCPVGQQQSELFPAHGFASDFVLRPRALTAALSYCGMGGPSFHKQMQRQCNHYVTGANTCTLVKDLTGLTDPHCQLFCEYSRQCQGTCQFGEPVHTRSCCVDK